MVETSEPKIWDLTLEEVAELMERRNKRRGLRRLLAELSGMLGEQMGLEEAFWEAMVLRLGIPRSENLIADASRGKVWVKGEVPDMKPFEATKVSWVDERG